MDRARFDAIAETFDLARIPPGETVLPGTLVLERKPALTKEHASLPRLEVEREGEDESAELLLGELLGAGGMGAVYVAHQRSLRRDVAVKRLREGPHLTNGIGALLAEARTVGALEHPNIVPVHLLGLDTDGTPVLVMKRIEGATLASLLAEPDHGAWSELERRYGDREAAIIEILMRVADGLEFAHSRGYLHRDVKPENIMVGSFGEVYLVDWGVALAPGMADDGSHQIVGTPAFMAPEMVYGDPSMVDARTDVYLLGATLHCALTKENARHRGERTVTVLFAAMTSAPVAYEPGVPEELAALANRATAADRAARPASAAELRDALADYLRHRGSSHLTLAAQARLDALRPAPDRDPAPASLATPESFAVLSECRFALTQALAEWSENERARRALRTTLSWMAEAEIERRSADGAATIARAIDPPDATLEARIDALRNSITESRALEEEGRREREERDLTKTSRWRVPITLALLVVCVGIFVSAVAFEAEHRRAMRMDRVAVVDVVVVGLLAAVFWVVRKRMLTNRLSRQLASLLLLSLGATTVASQVFGARGETSTEAGPLAVMMVGAVYLGGAVGIGGRLWYAAGVCFAAGIAAAIWPWTSTSMVGVGIVGSLAALVYDGLGPRSNVSG